MNILTVDNFLDDPDSERSRALSSKYEKIEHMGTTYNGVEEVESPEQYEKIKTILGAKEGRFHSYYRRYMDGDGHKEFIHSDLGVGEAIGILFLTAPDDCNGGLAFWKHKKYGIEVEPQDDKRLAAIMKEDGEDESLWEMTDYVPMLFNRLVIFYAPRYHSRYPKSVNKDSIEKTRIIKAFSYIV
jgi:hypothetical protein